LIGERSGGMVAERWLLREYREGDEEAIIGLHREVFGSEADRRWWEWRYLGGPAGRAIMMLAESNGRIVGQYAVVPVRMKMGHETCLAGLSLDTMVHPDYRGGGMFTRLAEAAYATASERGYRWVYGFPNGNSHHGFVARLGWTDLYDGIPLWVRPLNLGAVIRKRYGSRLVAGAGACAGRVAMGLFLRPRKATGRCSVREIRHFDERFDGLWKDVSERYRIAVIRDRAYLEWRYARRPDAAYTIFAAEDGDRLGGYVVLRAMPRFGLKIGFIMEMVVAGGMVEISRDLIAGSLEFFRRGGMDIVGCLVPPTHPDARLWREMGFLRVPKRALPQDMFWGVRSFLLGDGGAYLTNPSNWYISWGDHDSV